MFWLFRYQSVTQKQTETNKKKLGGGGFRTHWKTQLKQIEFRFVSVQTKKIECFEDTLIESVSWRFFLSVSVCFEKVLFVSVVLILVRNIETNRKEILNFAKQTEKQPKQIEFRFVSVLAEK